MDYETEQFGDEKLFKCPACSHFYTFTIEDMKWHMRSGRHNHKVKKEKKVERKRVSPRQKIYNY